MDMQTLYLAVPLAPLAASILVGLFGPRIGRSVSHWLCILGVAIALAASFVIWQDVRAGNAFNGDLYTWAEVAGVKLVIGFLIDPLTTTMMLVVTFVSLMVHIYTIGYMEEDPGYTLFFSYISLFTFSMLMLVMSNNFLQLFFGWEAVGLVSYLLIGFWYTRPSAIYANLKAFMVNRVGDFGFVLGIGLVLAHFGSLDYAQVFERAPALADTTVDLWGSTPWSLMSVVCICLFIGAMGKSAQVPLHVWLPDSMEGPTPISALIHAATMVTAGIFMVARMSPLFELSETALSFVTIIGAVTALSMAFLGIVQNDIKRVVAYSTLSQLGYMTVALGVSAYSAAIFHLMTHAFFKALLFLAAGSVIIAMHHEQDLRKMGGLWRYLPVTWVTAVIGSLALAGVPPFAGFFSKDAIIEATHLSTIPGHGFAYFAVMAGVFITAFYSFRMLFLAFHGNARWKETAHHGHGHAEASAHAHDASHDAGAEPDAHGGHGVDAEHPPKESPWVVTVPLVLLAIPSIYAGWDYIEPMLFTEYFGNAIVVAPEHDVLGEMKSHWQGVAAFIRHGLTAPVFWLALAGIVAAWFCYLFRPGIPERLRRRAGPIYTLLDNKYYFDRINEVVFAAGSRKLGTFLSNVGDRSVIDGFFVNGSARLVNVASRWMRRIQSGYVYHYAFTMIVGVFALLAWFNR